MPMSLLMLLDIKAMSKSIVKFDEIWVVNNKYGIKLTLIKIDAIHNSFVFDDVDFIHDDEPDGVALEQT